jgi:endonuclease YncB( thermonuclease family)
MHRQVQLALLLLFITTAPAWAFTGRVVSVHDGDTITIQAENATRVRVRLYGIDAPELRQEHGHDAQLAMSSMVAGRQVEARPMARDRYGRTVALVRAGNATSVNEEMVRQGWAWVYLRYCREPFCPAWTDIEAVARDTRAGLWSSPFPLAPWSWRRK